MDEANLFNDFIQISQQLCDKTTEKNQIRSAFYEEAGKIERFFKEYGLNVQSVDVKTDGGQPGKIFMVVNNPSIDFKQIEDIAMLFDFNFEIIAEKKNTFIIQEK